MISEAIATEAGLDRATVGGITRLTAHGDWTIDTVAALERAVDAASGEGEWPRHHRSFHGRPDRYGRRLAHPPALAGADRGGGEGRARPASPPTPSGSWMPSGSATTIPEQPKPRRVDAAGASRGHRQVDLRHLARFPRRRGDPRRRDARHRAGRSSSRSASGSPRSSSISTGPGCRRCRSSS